MKLTDSSLDIDYSAVDSVGEVSKALKKLDSDLEGTDLKNLQNFNKAYFIITKNVKNHLDRGGFKYPDFLHKFDARFAWYYLRALDDYLQKKPIPPAWEIAFNKCKKGKASPFIYMSLGINAHINNDIPQSLRDCLAQDKHYQDYEKVNEIIYQSIYEVIDSLEKDNTLLNPKRSVLKPAYKAGMDALVRRWRKNAWDRYLLLSAGKLRKEELEKIAHNYGLELLKLPL